MAKPKRIRTAVIGVGNMGSSHVDVLTNLENTELVAVCDIDHARADQIAKAYKVKAFYDHHDLLDRMKLDAVVIATPHYSHTPISIDSLRKGIHVLVEKPLAVHVNDGNRMVIAYEIARGTYPNLVFAIMFQQRTQGYWRKVKQMIDQGELGKLVRVTWIITDWFRTQSYYDHGGWRATWKGEGGGVLLNQCPHNLDLYQWFFGVPRRITGLASIGKYHHIEVEDEVTAFFEHPDGMVGHFITSTAESPGTNRLEIVGELGKLVCEAGQLTFYRNKESMFEFLKTSPNAFDRVEYQPEEVPFESQDQPGHAYVLRTFADVILHGGDLVAKAAEGFNSLMLGNAIMLSHFIGQPVDLPLNGDKYAAILQDLIQKSTFQKETREGTFGDLTKSFGTHH